MVHGETENIALLEKIVDVQRRIIAEEVNPKVTAVPQLWCLYKEVQNYYEAGLRVPDDVTLLWAEDNWGNVRRLPTAQERTRAGGAGVYYHFDYHGGPRSYQWINTSPLPKIWDQMTLAKQYGADRIWIVNVGHFKGYELPTEFFLDLAWNTDRWTHANLREYTRLWAAREFGQRDADEAAAVLETYPKFNARRKPELLAPTTYSLTQHGEADRVVSEFTALAARADAVYRRLPSHKRDAFYQLVLQPTLAAAQVNELYVAAGKNALYASQGRASTNEMAARVRQLFKADQDLMSALQQGVRRRQMGSLHGPAASSATPPGAIRPSTVSMRSRWSSGACPRRRVSASRSMVLRRRGPGPPPIRHCRPSIRSVRRATSSMSSTGAARRSTYR